MRIKSILVIAIFGTVYLLARVLINTSKKISDEFVHKSIKMLSEQSILYFVLVSLMMVIYTFGVLDFIQINWQFLISALYIFGVCWFFFCILITFFCYFIIKKWKELEESSKNWSKFLINLRSSKGWIRQNDTTPWNARNFTRNPSVQNLQNILHNPFFPSFQTFQSAQWLWLCFVPVLLSLWQA